MISISYFLLQRRNSKSIHENDNFLDCKINTMVRVTETKKNPSEI